MRLTEEERDIILEKMRDLGIISREAYIRKMALTGHIVKIDMSEVREALRLLFGVSNNINQMAKRANETRSIYANDVIQLREEVRKIRAHVSEVLNLGGKLQRFFEL